MNTPFVRIAIICLVASGAARAANDEFKVKREAEFAFAAAPSVERDGDRVAVSFTTRGRCDVTIAVEDGGGRIVRHLASGVLGPNAPAPFATDSLNQKIVWDGKDDQGRYVKDLAAHRIRVSLGLAPKFERVLLWSPKQRVARNARPLITATPDGVFVFEGEGVDFLRMFDHAGNYVRTVYPFPAGKLDKARGLLKAEFPQSGQELPLKHGLVQATLLTSGGNTGHNTRNKYEPGATAMAIGPDGRIALAGLKLNRLHTDGTTGGRDLEGPATTVATNYRGEEFHVEPRSAALSPDGKTVYLTGYNFKPQYPRPHHWIPAVTRVDFAGGGKMEVFAGSTDLGGAGKEPGKFRAPTSVATDPQGRVYVADYYNSRLQVFDPSGKFLREVKAPQMPVEVMVHQKTGQLYAASWMLLNRWSKEGDVKEPTLTRFAGFDEGFTQQAHCPLPIKDHVSAVFMNRNGGFPYSIALDSWTEKPTFWLIPAKSGYIEKLMIARGSQDLRGAAACIDMLVESGDKLELLRDFGEEVVEKVVRAKPPIHSRRKLYVNPTNGYLYVFEGLAGVSKSAAQLIEIDPETGRIRELQLPFDCEDLAIDSSGLWYLRTDNVVGRFAFGGATFREVPYDYGEEMKGVGFSSGRDGRQTNLVGALVLPANRPGCFHQGGMGVNARGDLVVSCYNVNKPAYRKDEQGDIQSVAKMNTEGRAYVPKVFPGRKRWQEVHVWDKHGQVVHEDAAPGSTMMDGIAVDNKRDVYMMISPNRVLDGKPYFLERAETLVKVTPGEAKFVAAGKKSVQVPIAEKPAEHPDLFRGGPQWVQGAQWMYGGVGFGGFNSSKGGGGCACWHARFTLDHYGRSFAPEVDHFSVAVLDTAGNLVMRIGQYGNADDGVPLVADGGPPNPQAIGGDEVALFDAAYVAAHSDRRLFVADGGNARIISVKMDYHTSQRVDIPEK